MAEPSLCSLPYEDADDYAQFWREKIVRPRKEHRCCECRRPVAVGTKAGFATGLYDGIWATFYRCSACLILAELAATLDGQCPLWGGLDEFVANVNDNYGKNLPYPQEHRERWDAMEAADG